MEDIGTEVSLKIRSAIKAKLMELGAFVDDELPDYIMVMVANKRSKQQMETDLQLFLGSNTANFTGWLHTVLQKLEEVTIANNLALSQKKAAEASKHADGAAEPSSKSKLSTSGPETEGHKHKPEKRKKSSEGSSKRATKESKSGGKTSSGKKSTKTKVLDVGDVTNSSNGGTVAGSSNAKDGYVGVSDLNSGGRNAERRTIREVMTLSLKKEVDVQESELSAKKIIVPVAQAPAVRKPSPRPSAALQSDEDDDDFINIKDDAEAMELLDSELSDSHKLSRKVAAIPPQTSKPNAGAQLAGEDEVDELEQQRANLLRDLKLLDRPKRSALFERLGSKVEPASILDRLGSRPRLNIIDPNELDIVGPTPREVELTKLKVADRLGKRSAVGDASSVSLDESSRGAKRTVSVVHSEREVSRPTVMDRLGKKVEPGSPPERKSRGGKRQGGSPPGSPRGGGVMDRLGKRQGGSPTGSPRGGGVMDRLGIRQGASPPGSPRGGGVMDRLGKRQAEHEGSDRDERNNKKRPSRILNIKEALMGELQHSGSASSKRQADQHSNDEDEVPRKRSLLSRVVAVKRDSAAPRLPTEEDEEYDPTNPAVASVIRVKPRPKVPAAMQATKNLLLKAMAEAQKSVSTAPKRQEAQRAESLFTRKYRTSAQPLEKINITVANSPPKRREDSVEEDGDSTGGGDCRYRRKDRHEAGRKVGQKIVGEVPAKTKTSVDKASTLAATQGDKPAAGPDTCGGEEEEEEDDEDVVFEEIFEDDDLNDEDLIEMTASNGDSNLGNVSPINNEDDNGAGGTVEYIPTKIGEGPAVEPARKGTGRASSPQFVVTLDGLDPDIFNPRKRTVDATRGRERGEDSGVTSPTPVLDPDTDDRAKKEEERNEQNASPVVYKKPKLTVMSVVEPVKPLTVERCKYWPACGKGEQCEFLHPSTPCKMFPGCKFGDRCLYVHPNCKFDISCTRRECPYSHTGARSSASQVQVSTSGKSRPHSQALCKFYPKCSNVNCSFLHPKPCRFGRACTNRDCSFFHEEIPTAEKLKWVNSNRC